MVQKSQLEIACFNKRSALIAQENNADRVELCDGFEVGGTTPDFQTAKEVRDHLSIDLYVMIRPRGGNFVYTEDEFLQMKASISAMKQLNVNGFVFGILNENDQVNVVQNSELVRLAQPFPCTFHRAFDEVSDVFQSLEDVIQCGFQTILTSGQKSNVVDGVSCLSELVQKAENRITIMPGGGLRSSNIEFIQQKTQAVFFHSSAITDGGMIPNPTEIQALLSKINASY